MYLSILITILLGSCFSYTSASLKFSNRTSTVRINSGGSLSFDSMQNNWNGTLNQQGTVNGSIAFNCGIFEEGKTPAFFNGTYDSSSSQKIVLDGNKTIRINSGPFIHRIKATNTGNRIEGQSLFADDTPALPNIEMTDSSAALILALQSKLNSFIKMNNGTLTLDDDLQFADGKDFVGQGAINLNNKRIAFGGEDLHITNTLFLHDATDIILNAKTSLSGTWSFDGANAYLNGNGNVLDLGMTGTLWVKAGTTLHLVDVKLKGLGKGQGSIVFENKDSRVCLSNTQICLSNNYSVTQGGFLIDGPTTIITSNHKLIFDQQGSLTVNGETLWYDTLDNPDSNNIQPLFNALSNPGGKNVSLLNDGIIRHVLGSSLSITNTGNLFLNANIYIDYPTRWVIDQDLVVDGSNHFIYFSQDPGLITIQPGVTLQLTNVHLRSFSPHRLIGGGDVIFGPNTTIDITENPPGFGGSSIQGLELTQSWTFVGNNNTLSGKNCIFTLGDYGQLVVSPGGTLRMLDLAIDGIKDNNIRCESDTSKIVICSDVDWSLDGNFSFTKGALDVYRRFDIHGSYTFAYQSAMTSSIEPFTIVTLDNKVTFSYAPSVPKRDLIRLIGDSSVLYLNGATLHATHTGMFLHTGSIFVDKRSSLEAELQFHPKRRITLGGGIEFGDGLSAHDAKVTILAGATLSLRQGKLKYRNVNASSWVMLDRDAQLKMERKTVLVLDENLFLDEGHLLLHSTADLRLSTGKTIIGSVLVFDE